MNKKIYLIRSNSTKFGGAENYLYRLSNALKNENLDHEIIHSFFPKFLPSWARAILFNMQVRFSKKEKFYYSLDRITCPDIYRAGDGVHKVFISMQLAQFKSSRRGLSKLCKFIYIYIIKKIGKHIINGYNI